MLGAAGLFAVWVNTYQGLFNGSTAQWNASPNIDEFPEYLFDWRYPQFLHTRARGVERLARHNAEIVRRDAVVNEDAKISMQRDLDMLGMVKMQQSKNYKMRLASHPIALAAEYDFHSSNLYFLGWSQAEALFRWSDGHHAEILFYLDASSTPPKSINFTVGAFQRQRFRVLLNEHELGTFLLDNAEQMFLLEVASDLFVSGGVNVLHFELPDAKRPGNGDIRRVALAFKKIIIN